MFDPEITEMVRERFHEKWVEDGECWRWTAAFSNRGYSAYRESSGHRYSYAIHVGPIPDGLEIDHLCRNKWCVNPDHLEAVTPSENTLRAKGDHCKHGHEYTPENTMLRQMPAGHTTRRCRECGRNQWRKYKATTTKKELGL
jgi:hypothetical protein